MASRLRIAHVVNTDFFGRFLMLNQLRYLRDAGYDTHLVTGAGPLVPEIEAEGIPVTLLALSREISPLADVGTLVRLARHFRRSGTQLVHTHTPKLNLLGPLAARMAGVRHVVGTVHGYYFHEDMSPKRLAFFKLLERMASASMDLVFTQSREDYATALREQICPAGKLAYLGNGVDHALFNPDRFGPGDVLRIKEKIGIPGHAPVVGLVGRLVKEKGYLEFVTAAKHVAARRSDVHFVLIGPDERWQKRDALKGEALAALARADRALDGRLHLLGLRRNLPALYAAMDVVTLPSYREGIPRSLLEAAAMARPIVASDIRGCREIVRDGENGFLIPVKDSFALADRISTLLEAPQRAREMGLRGRTMALSYDEQEVCRKVVAGYERLLSGKMDSHFTRHSAERGDGTSGGQVSPGRASCI